MITIQVGPNLYAFKHRCNRTEWVCYVNLLNEQPIQTVPKSTPPTPRTWPSLANYMDSFVLAIGGCNPSNWSQRLRCVDLYCVEMDTWQ